MKFRSLGTACIFPGIAACAVRPEPAPLQIMKQLLWMIAIAMLLTLQCPAVLAADNVMKPGKELYEQFCASCHGVGGRGDGPVADSLKVEVPDLTRLAQRRGNYFDRAMVERVIDGRYTIGAHGSRMMPVWGEDFSRAEIGNPDAERTARTLIVRLADYLWQLQRPAP